MSGYQSKRKAANDKLKENEPNEQSPNSSCQNIALSRKRLL